MTFTSKTMTLDALVDEVMRDKAFYDKTGGGVTASGGECMMQSSFLRDFFEELSSRGVDTAIDTCGLVPYASFEKVLPYTDHVFYDLKLLDGVDHQKCTGQGNDLILENVRRIALGIARGQLKCDLWIRTPLIPGATATPENIASIGKFIAGELHGAVVRWDLCAFNNSCAAKYERLGIVWAYKDKPLLSGTAAQALKAAACSCGFSREKIVLSGIIAQA
jgi:pyruvate formate lyase activating enzyme